MQYRATADVRLRPAVQPTFGAQPAVISAGESTADDALFAFAAAIQSARRQRRTTLGVEEVRALLALAKAGVVGIPTDCAGQVITHILAELDRRSDKTGWGCLELRRLVLEGFLAAGESLLERSGLTERPVSRKPGILP